MKLIIFDFDGVIEDTYELHYQMSKLQIKNLSREEHKKLFEGNIHLERGKLKSRQTGFNLKKEFDKTRENLITSSETKKILKDLLRNYFLGIITSSLEKGIKKYIQKNNLENVFSFVYGYETNKSKKEKFKRVLQEFKLQKDECIFITDTLGDIFEAKEVGIKSIAIDSGYHEKERLQKGKPFSIISSLGLIFSQLENFPSI